ncbi:transcriptional regulator [Fusarium pseudocircinatum]|uniref:Transcriptional regulator n=1 Tax=Fusarium pseudocircinatum TaxID=56676 RepID=A0A8H5NTT9_9HYPO|nr:transcriptional regulator [Fusarium pseudocircinatum]
MTVRYTSKDVSPEPLAQELHLYPSGRVAKNRFLKSPMAESLASWDPEIVSKRGIPTEELIELYRRWGEGRNNFGIVVTGNIDIDLTSVGAAASPSIPVDAPFEGERFEKFKQLATAAKKDGSLFLAQVNHPGRQVPYKFNPVAISASDVQLDPKMGMTFGKPHAATKDEIAQIIEGFAHAAEYLEKAGFDGIELHAAHGYLLSQFLSRTTNKRTDEYGTQTVENRLRLISEIAAAIKARVSPTFIVSAKLNSVEFQDGGVTPDEARELCERLEALGFDFVELSGGTYERMALSWEKESTKQREGFFLEWAETITKALDPAHKMRIFIAGGLRTVGAMVDALDVVDGVSIGRPAAAEPRLAGDIIEGRVKGAIQPVEMVENDLGMGMGVAGAQFAQVAKGFEPLDASNSEVVQTFGQDMGAWYEKLVQDGDKNEFVRAIQYSGPQAPYGKIVRIAFSIIRAVEPASSEGSLILQGSEQGRNNKKSMPLFLDFAVQIGNPFRNNRQEGLEARLARIEEQLQIVLNAAKDAQATRPQRLDDQSSPSDSAESVLNNSANFEEMAKRGFAWKFDPINPAVYQGPQPNTLELPPLDEILPIVDHYFTTFNGVIPLFQQPEFMKLLSAWYKQPETRDRASWAAIQTVMAIGYRTPQLSLRDSQSVHIEKADQCLRNAQTVVSELVTRDEDLLGVQILLGIVMLFQNSRDPKPASVLIGTAVRLAHRLKLHSQEAAMQFPAAEAEQRSRVFWIAYTLDKDICLRAQTPSCQFDEDIDISLPVLAPPDSVGLIWTQNGQVHFNYHRRRVELAYIQGKVYDLLYSNRSSKVTAQERQRRVTRLQSMLDQWYERIPNVFHIEHVAATVGPSQLVQMTKMHHAFLLTEVMIHGIYSHNAEWVKRISSFSRATLTSVANLETGGFGAGKCQDQAPPLPEGWNHCVDVSRGCMKLFQEATPTECLIWYVSHRESWEIADKRRQCSCSHFSALIVLLANMILNPGHSSIHIDQHLSVKALDLFDKLLKIIDDEVFRALRSVVGELSQRAQTAVAVYREELKGLGRDVFEGLNVDDVAVQEVDFLPAGDTDMFEGLEVEGPFVGLDGPFVGLSGELERGFGDGMSFMDGGVLDMEFMR